MNLWRGARKSFALILCSDRSCGDEEAVAALAPYALVPLASRTSFIEVFVNTGELPEVANFRIFFRFVKVCGWRSTEAMDDDDDFGDLYADMGAEEEARAGGNSSYRKLEGAGREYGEHADDEDDELLLYGASASSLATAKTHAAGSSVGRHPPFVAGYEVGEKDVDNEEQMLYGQLYGSSSAKPSENAAPSSIVNLEASLETVADKSRLEAVVFNRGGLKAKDISGLGVHDAQSIPFGAFASGEKRMHFIEAEPEVDVPSGELGISAPVAADSGLLRRPLNVAGSYDLAMSGGPFLEEEIGGTVGAGMGGIVGEEEDDWDSDSEDDLQIVLNDETAGFNNLERGVDGEYLEGSEDDEDLVIVAGTEPLEGERDGGEDDILSEGHLPGPPSGPPPLGADKSILGLCGSFLLPSF